ncbi:Senescence_reg domain-containing protein [Cephalotus follicularis]|uniref:Senescence_reg domain-containing protein n=1 Tax=Cephalotus follicularis TaxID=3775 RepID=A0A1Q3CWU3_CEPFO|nr:Senescence_reg domain-containing protein [Cephalotus follicularis]
MDLNGPTPIPTRFRPRKSPSPSSTSRFLGAYSHSPSSSATDQELNEDDIVFTPDFSSTSSPPPPPPPRHNHHHHNNKRTAFPENPGILAALPETSATHSHLYKKTVIPSTSSGSPSRLIPKPPQERIPLSSSLGKYHQSAPVNVPVFPRTMRKHREFDEIDLDEEEEGDAEMLPPHQMVARSQTPVVACSVLEGVGRTLKGRDLRQVRNAIWRRTGFLD